MARNAGVKIEFLRQMNPSYIRKSVVVDDILIDSIRDKGILFPVLTSSSYEIIDGARRMEAAWTAGLDEVPVIATDDLVLICRLMTESHTHPLWTEKTWMENIDLIRNVLGPRVRHHRALAGTATRRGDRKASQHRDMSKQIAASIGLSFHHYNCFSQLGKRLEEIAPGALRDKAREIIMTCEVQRLTPGSAVTYLNRDPELSGVLAPVTGAPVPAADVQVRVIESSATAIRTLVDTMRSTLETINPDMTAEQAAFCASLIGKSEYGAYRLRNRLKTFAEAKKRSGDNS